MHVLLFAGLKEKIGDSSIVLPVEESITAHRLREQLYTSFPRINGEVFQIACNEAFVKDDFIIKDTDEVALIPPVSGG
ncbi:MoaD/ThiS family protein [Salinicoccus albus]|uniref:MoaD/ThiS family protein n=1 Tax=Salinicoccus albus TaxID=418756 RepID=UPI00037FECB9|nr:MoaD/ThiS family protein [Salinicoccus albus]